MDPDGVTYLGDGAWGITSTDVFLNSNSWWISAVSRTPHVYIVTASENVLAIDAVNSKDEIL